VRFLEHAGQGVERSESRKRYIRSAHLLEPGFHWRQLHLSGDLSRLREQRPELLEVQVQRGRNVATENRSADGKRLAVGEPIRDEPATEKASHRRWLGRRGSPVLHHVVSRDRRACTERSVRNEWQARRHGAFDATSPVPLGAELRGRIRILLCAGC
jgi:hypothetical protein